MLSKPPAFEGIEYPYEKLTDRRFEKLLYHIFDRDIRNGIYQGQYDKVDLMSGVGERGRDSILYLKGAKVGVIQCKKHSRRLAKPEAAREVIKFVLHYLKDDSLITDPDNLTYYLAASKDFTEPAIDLLSDFGAKITDEQDIRAWTIKVIGDSKSLQTLNFDDTKDALFRILCSIEVQKITPDDLDYKLGLYPDLLPLFFEVQKVKVISDSTVLSTVPRTERPLLDHAPVGREADIAWLREDSGDKLLVGQPGSGKTFLLYKLAREGRGFFVRNRECGEIAAAIRSWQPNLLIVDDAHTHANYELLVDLVQIRRELGVQFSILASCWPGDGGRIAEALTLTEQRVRRLDLLTRDKIVEVIKIAGIYGPDEFVREIVDQAEGRPGLAVTLTQLCRQGGVREVVLGDALSRSVLKFFKPIVGRRASVVLAAFSIGGDSGMPMKAIARELNLKEIELWEILTELSAGGVIWQIGRHCLSVRPATLRHALVRDVFFKGLPLLPIERLFAQAPDLSHVARTLIGAKALGADVPQELLIGILEQARSNDEWRRYAGLGHDEASWVLQNHPAKIIVVARSALHNAPGMAIPLLLEQAIGDQRPLHSTTEHPLRLIEDWIHDGRPDTGQMFRRRNILFESARDWLSSGGDTDVGLRAFQSILSPKFKYHTTGPGMGNKVTIHYGYPSMDEMLAIQSLWPKILEVTRTTEIVNWEPIRRMAEAWAYPGRVNVKISSEVHQTMCSFAGQMLRDLVSLAQDHPGVMHWASQVAEHLDLDIKILLDLHFEVLYPVEDLEDWKAAEKRQKSAVCKLAKAWTKLDPVQVAKWIASIEREARLTDIGWPRWTPFLCAEIAATTASPNTWIQAMIDANATSDLVEPLLCRAAEIDEPGWVELAFACLQRPRLRAATISLALTLSDPPENLLAAVLQKVDGYAKLVEIHCIRNQVPEHLVGRLLRHESAAIASAAAQGEWHADPEGSVRDSLHEDWREVVIHRVSIGHWLGKVLKDDPLLAYGWLEARMAEQTPRLFSHYKVAVEAAVNALDIEARRRILHRVPETYGVEELVACLVGENLALYRELLNDERLKRLHLVPLVGHPEGVWMEKAKLALDAGYSFEEVAGAVRSYPLMVVSWSGKESTMWAEWVEQFDRLCSHEDARIRKVGEAGRARAKASRDRAVEQERDEAIYGIEWR